jgi:hypothetical protein
MSNTTDNNNSQSRKVTTVNNTLTTADDENLSTWSTVEYWEGVAESVVRVTAAGFAGSLIGLAKERLHQPVETIIPSSSSSKVLVYEQSGNAQKSVTTRRTLTLPRRPPQIHMSTSIKSTSMTNLPIMWSISCMLFTIILESSRLASPTNIIYKIIDTTKQQQPSTTMRSDESNFESVHDDNTDEMKQRKQFQNLMLRTACVSFGDYTIGGTIAGLAGVVGQQYRQRLLQQQSPILPVIQNRIPTIRFGLATGLGLGIVAGTIQAIIDACNLYLEKERQEEILRKQQQETAKDELVDGEEVEEV